MIPRTYNDYWRVDPETDLTENFLIKSDSYKVTHWPQYPPGTEFVESYFESRGCTPKKKNGSDLYDYTLYFGLQYVLLRHFTGRQITHFKIDQAKEFAKQHFGTDTLFNEIGWRYIADNYGGYLPIEIHAVKEGTKVGLKNVLYKIRNTDPNCSWLTYFCTNFAETLLQQVWHPTTVATNSAHARDILIQYHEKTCDTVFVDYSLHDFGARGGSSYETSVLGGMAHLVSFNGTDTMAAIAMVNKTYNSKIGPQAVYNITIKDSIMYGHSVVATEHSTMTPWGRYDEKKCVLNLLRHFPTGIISVVGDSFNIFTFTKMLYEDAEIRQLILERDGKFVLRPDSGDPVEIDCKLMQMLYDGFGGTVNSKGYKVLNSKIGIIQGDGIDLMSMIDILEALTQLEFASSNIVFGSGGGLIQKFDRDTLKIAIKCSHIQINGESIDVQKDPITSSGKKSKKGHVGLFVDENGRLYSKEEISELEDQNGILELVFTNGELRNFQTFDEIRHIARNIPFVK